MKEVNKRRITFLPLVLAIFLVGGMLLGNMLSRLSSTDRFQVYPKNSKISNVIDYISAEYVDSIDINSLIDHTIPDILKQLDPHSIYIPAVDLQEFNEPLEGNFSGIGVQFNMQEDTVAIVTTIQNGPSEKAGILAGDRIVRVDDSLVAGVKMPSDDIVKMLKGKKGTQVDISIARRGVDDLIDFVITRDNIPLYSVDVHYMITDDIGYIKISNFSRTTYQEFMDAVNALNEQGLKKLILDLRNNGGGYLDAATQITDEFLEKGKLIVYTEGRAQPRRDAFATAKGELIDKDIVVLIDESSASASEILAGAIQDNDRGTIVGRRSFGKGLVQEQTTFSDGSAIRLTIARYYTPTGRCIQRPYDNGMEEYYHDLQTRFGRGELVEQDSIRFADTLQYTTPGGRIVYGGGGIMPDVFVPYDTTLFTPYFINVRNRGFIYRFAFKYTDAHRDELQAFDNHRDISEFLDKQKLLAQFADFAEEMGIKRDLEDMIISEKLIITQLKAYIARNVIDNPGFYPIIQDVDPTLQKGIEILSQLPSALADS
ncbi:MAG: S41 family peptidase [Bacteroidales bacterium]|nr:S41 family peptidase [Bacteroidales bacterium]